MARVSGLKNRGVKIRTDIGILKRTNKPCYFIEVCFVNDSVDVALYRKNFEQICHAIAEQLAKAVGKTLKVPVSKPVSVAPVPETNIKGESVEVMLTETGRIAIRDLIKKTRYKGLVKQTVHTDAAVASYTDKQLLSYQASIINMTFK